MNRKPHYDINELVSEAMAGEVVLSAAEKRVQNKIEKSNSQDKVETINFLLQKIYLRDNAATATPSDANFAPDSSAQGNSFRVFKHRLDRLFVAEDSTTLHARNAECIYLRMFQNHGTGSRSMSKKIESIDYIYNERLAQVFEHKKLELIQNYGAETGVEMLLFHGTNAKNVDSIIRNNFNLNLCRRFAYGKGLYFSELPSTSFTYGDALILCRVLTGRVQKPCHGPKFDPTRFHSFQTNQVKHQLGTSDKSDEVADIHVIASPDQVLPYCVYHFENQNGGNVQVYNAGLPMQSYNQFRNSLWVSSIMAARSLQASQASGLLMSNPMQVNASPMQQQYQMGSMAQTLPGSTPQQAHTASTAQYQGISATQHSQTGFMAHQNSIAQAFASLAQPPPGATRVQSLINSMAAPSIASGPASAAAFAAQSQHASNLTNMISTYLGGNAFGQNNSAQMMPTPGAARSLPATAGQSAQNGASSTSAPLLGQGPPSRDSAGLLALANSPSTSRAVNVSSAATRTRPRVTQPYGYSADDDITVIAVPKRPNTTNTATTGRTTAAPVAPPDPFGYSADDDIAVIAVPKRPNTTSTTTTGRATAAPVAPPDPFAGIVPFNVNDTWNPLLTPRATNLLGNVNGGHASSSMDLGGDDNSDISASNSNAATAGGSTSASLKRKASGDLDGRTAARRMRSVYEANTSAPFFTRDLTLNAPSSSSAPAPAPSGSSVTPAQQPGPGTVNNNAGNDLPEEDLGRRGKVKKWLEEN